MTQLKFKYLTESNPFILSNSSTLVEETGREYSDPEEVPVRYRSNSLPQSRRGSSDLSDETHQPIVRRVGSRQMLVLGDDISSIHGKMKWYHFRIYSFEP